MTRSMTAAMAAEIVKPAIAPVWLIEAEFSSGAIRIWTGTGTIVWNGHEWSGVSDLLGLSPLTDTQNVEARGMSISLSGVPSDLIATVYGENAQGRPSRVWLGMMSDAGALLADPVPINRGRMDQITDQDSGTECTITVTVENGLRDLRKPSVRRYTHQDQQRLFPGDRGLEFVAALQEKEIFWGRAGDSGL